MTGGVRWGVAVAVCAVLVVGGTGVTAGATDAENEAPLPDAGLDQDVVVNETILLDAGGSRDPDGEVTGYEWEIETPGGATVTPECPDCVRTEFQVTRTGTYNATVTVTDDDGAKRSDTARITVEEVDPPSVEVSGSTDVLAGDATEYTATLEAGDYSLVRVDWYVDGGLHDRRSVDGDEATDTVELTFDEPGNHTVTAEAYDVIGRDDEATVSVDVSTPESSRPCLAAVWNVTTGDWDTDDCGPDPGSSDLGDNDAGGNGEACSEYGSGEDKPAGDREACDDDRLRWYEDGSGVEVWDGDSNGKINFGPHNMTYEEAEAYAEDNDGVQWDSTSKVLEYESQDRYEELTGVPPNIRPNAPVNENPGKYGGEDRVLEDYNNPEETTDDDSLICHVPKLCDNKEEEEDDSDRDNNSGGDDDDDDDSGGVGCAVYDFFWCDDDDGGDSGDDDSDDGDDCIVLCGVLSGGTSPTSLIPSSALPMMMIGVSVATRTNPGAISPPQETRRNRPAASSQDTESGGLPHS